MILLNWWLECIPARLNLLSLGYAMALHYGLIGWWIQRTPLLCLQGQVWLGSLSKLFNGNLLLIFAVLHIFEQPWLFFTLALVMFCSHFVWNVDPEKRYWKQGVKLLAEPVAVRTNESSTGECRSAVIQALFDPSSGDLDVRHAFS